jgi:hypothetical protein
MQLVGTFLQNPFHAKTQFRGLDFLAIGGAHSGERVGKYQSAF